MPKSKGEKDTYFNIRVNQQTKLAFQQVAKKRSVKMSSLFMDFVLNEIEKEGISINDFVAENQISMFENNCDDNTNITV